MLAFERKAQLLAQVAEKRAQKVSGSLVRQFRDELKNRSMVRSLGHHGAIISSHQRAQHGPFQLSCASRTFGWSGQVAANGWRE